MGKEKSEKLDSGCQCLPSRPEEIAGLEAFKLFRSYAIQEDSLINQRTTWFILLQSFLFTSLALLLDDVSGVLVQILIFAIALVGFAISVTTFVSVAAARLATKTLDETWKEKWAPDADPRLPSLLGGQAPNSKLDVKVEALGFLTSRWIPETVGLVWLVVPFALIHVLRDSVPVF